MRALDRDGFVMSYISAITEEDYQSQLSDRNQLRLEARLRKSISTKKDDTLPPLSLKIGEKIGKAVWEPYYSHSNIFVDRCSFYSTLNRIRMYTATTLVSDMKRDVTAVLWSYMSTGAYLNGHLVAEIEYPVYKPIESISFTLHLEKGRNDMVFISDNLGVRDTRNMLAFQIIDGTGIKTTIPDEEAEEAYSEGSSFLDGISIGRGTLYLPSPAPAFAELVYSANTDDYTKKNELVKRMDIAGKAVVSIPPGIEKASVVLLGGMKRNFEFSERIKPEYLPERNSFDEHFRDILKRIAAVNLLDRGDHGFGCFSFLARKFLGIDGPDQNDLILNDIRLIKRRGDCADFLVCGLLRYIHEYGLPESLRKEAKDAIIDFRYWMTMKGADGMCFWSENHSLLFYYAACDAGLLYPDEYFPRADMTGRELHEYGERRVDEWMDDVLEHGFEEFLSSTYMCVTFAVLLNVIDYCNPDISRKARKVADRILEMLSLSTFKGAVIAPMGRVYRGVIYPFRECVAALIAMVNGDAPYAYGEGWLAFYATSTYRIPDGLKKLMDEDVITRYSTGNALVSIEKNDSYILTGVLSPRDDSSFVRWQNNLHDDSKDAEDNIFVKSINECFHGTSCFQPGVYGYQQHMWSAALSPSAVIFANHPGTSSEEAELRPGYWNGNGVMPAVSIDKGEIAAVYSIPDNHPIAFTHLYLPAFRFSDVRKEGNWIFLAEGSGYLAVWASGKLESHDDMIADSELRLYSRRSAYYVRAGKRQDCSFDEFIRKTMLLDVRFSEKDLELSVNGIIKVRFEAVDDWTQYLE